MPMRSLAVLLVVVFALGACASTQPDIVRRTGTQEFPPTQFVEVLDSAPTRPYTEIGIVDAPGEPGALRSQVLARIRAQAALIGADAVVLQDVSRAAPAVPRLNPTTGTYDTASAPQIPAFKGIAIRFR
ncbi:MAG: hypothetical protein IT518_24750 [Burkholderiales bacterium]|nr:hypothetical protein [Burkholderiales bacterium]